MKKKFYISASTERLFSFAATLMLILILGLILTNTLLKKLQKNAVYQFIQSCDDLTEDYSQYVEEKLQKLETELDMIYAKIAYKNFSSQEIRKIIVSEKENISPVFTYIFYSDKNGISYNMYGEVHDITERDYFKKIMTGTTKFYVSNVIEAKHDGTPIIVLVRPIFNDTSEIIGTLGACCSLTTIGNILDEIKIGTGKKISIRDEKSRLIKHYIPKWTNWTFSPGKYLDKNIETATATVIAKETMSIEGEPVTYFFRKIDNAPWTVGLTVTPAEFRAIEKSQHNYQKLIFLIIILALALIFLLELWIHSILERHQILSTHIDAVTHLWTKSYFESEANKLLKRYPNSKFMLIEADIRGFKFINQNYGEDRANKCLYQFSKIIYEQSKQHNALVSHGYADHFYTLLKIDSVHTAMKVFKKSLETMEKKIHALDIQFSPKYGISFKLPKKEENHIDIQTLISQATFAKSSIKENVLQQFAIYDSQLLKKSTAENYIESHMNEALDNNEFFVMYQPKVNLITEKIVGAEALVRWQSGKLGYMPPNSFVPLFERNNFIVKLDFYVYEQVCKFIRKCIDTNSPVVPISVNVSRNHNKPDKFIHDFMKLIHKYNVPSDLIEIELLERSTMDRNLLREITLLLHKEGFTVAMDDFGSGESSLNMLSTIPVDTLKFDRSFLYSNNEPIKLDESTANFIETLIDLGKNLKKQTIFEGVETKEQCEFLKKIKCDHVQGYFYSKPLRENEYISFLRKNRQK